MLYVYICSNVTFKYGTWPTLAIFPGLGSILFVFILW